jgi:hypothetical protein
MITVDEDYEAIIAAREEAKRRAAEEAGGMPPVAPVDVEAAFVAPTSAAPPVAPGRKVLQPRLQYGELAEVDDEQRAARMADLGGITRSGIGNATSRLVQTLTGAKGGQFGRPAYEADLLNRRQQQAENTIKLDRLDLDKIRGQIEVDRTEVYKDSIKAQRERDKLNAKFAGNKDVREGEKLTLEQAAAELKKEQDKRAAAAEAEKQRIERARLKQGEDELTIKRDAAKLKATEGMSAGWEMTGETTPDLVSLRKHQEMDSGNDELKGLIGALRGKIAASKMMERFDPFSPAAVAIKQLATAIELKSKDVATLGALSGPDLKLMQDLTADPTSIFSTARNMDAALDTLTFWGDNAVNAKGKKLGLRRKPDAVDKTTALTPASDRVWVIMNSDGRRRQLSRRAAEALVKAEQAEMEEVAK